MLNIRQEAFCLHYAKSGNATEAYKAAGYKPRNENVANAAAIRLLGNVKIRNRLAELAKEMESDKIASAKEIQERLTAILRMKQQQEQTVMVRDALKAAELLAKMQGAFDTTLKVDLTVPVFGGEDNIED